MWMAWHVCIYVSVTKLYKLRRCPTKLDDGVALRRRLVGGHQGPIAIKRLRNLHTTRGRHVQNHASNNDNPNKCSTCLLPLMLINL